MKRTVRTLSAMLLAVTLLFGQGALPSLGVVSAAAPNAIQTLRDEVQPATGWHITGPKALYVGMTAFELTVGGQKSEGTLTWESSNSSVAAVEGQKLTAKDPGSATIRASTPTEYAEYQIYVFSVEKADSYIYNGNEQGWDVRTNGTDTVEVFYGNGKTKPTDSGTYEIYVSMSSPVGVNKEKLGEFSIKKKSIESIELVGTTLTAEQFSTGDIKTDSAKVTPTEKISGDDADHLKEIPASCVIENPDVQTAGEKSGTAKIAIATPPPLKNYELKNNYTIANQVYTVKEIQRTVEELRLQTPPRLSYKDGDTLDLTALKVEVIYSKGDPQTIGYQDVTATPAPGTVLTKASHDGKNIEISYQGKTITAGPLVVTAPEASKVTPKLALSVSPETGKTGDVVTVKVDFDRNDSDKPFPAADQFKLTDNLKPGEKISFSSSADTKGQYTAKYTLPGSNVTLTVTFQGDDNFNSTEIKKDVKVIIGKPTPTLALTADKTSLPGGGDVKLTLKLSAPDGSPALPPGSEITLSNDRGWKTVSPSGSNGTYTATCSLPNQDDAVTFTASFKGNASFEPAKDATCKVTTTYAGANTGSALNSAIAKLPSTDAISKMDAEQKKAAEQQVRSIIKNISELSETQKNAIQDDSLEKLDQTLSKLTGASVQNASVASYYTSGSSTRVRDGATIKGALAAANAGTNEKVALSIDQKRNGSSSVFLQIDLSLKKGGSSVTLQTPVQVNIPLPASYVKRSGVELRHRKSSGGYEYPYFTINGSRGSYTLSFRANSFSLYTLYLPGNDNTGGGWDGGTTFDQYTIFAKAGTGGTISPSGEVRVDSGDDKTFTIKAKTGYKVDQVLVDGTKKVTLKNGKYTFEDVQESYSIEVTFKKDSSAVSSVPAASSKPQTSSKTQTSKPTAPTTSTAKPAPSSSRVVSSEPEPESSEVSSEPESSEVSSEPESSEEESLPESSEPPSSEESEPTTPTGGNSGGGMSDSDLTVAVVIIVVVIALSLAAIFFGVYLSRKRDEEEDEEDDGGEDQ